VVSACPHAYRSTMAATGRAGTAASGRGAATSLASDVADVKQALVTRSTSTLFARLSWPPDTAPIVVVRTAARWQEWSSAQPTTTRMACVTSSAHVHFGTHPKRAVCCCTIASYKHYDYSNFIHPQHQLACVQDCKTLQSGPGSQFSPNNGCADAQASLAFERCMSYR
jgi:hypothetical protein